MNQTSRVIATTNAAALAAGLVALAGIASGQDSTSNNANGGNGLPGDALSPWTGSLNRTNYVVDLSPLTTAAGTRFGIAPIMKSGRTNPNSKFTALNGASSISQTIRSAAYPAASYSAWTQPTAGVSPTDNNTALNTTVSPTGTATVFAAGFMDFDEVLIGATSVFTNQMYGGLIAFDPGAPSRLYVSRVNAAVNAASAALDRSQFGYGGIDADGNLCFRADSFGSAGSAATLLQGDNYFRVRLPARTTIVNLIDNAGGAQASATDWPLQRNTVTHTTPSALPADLAGRPFIVGADFVGNARLESSPNTTTSATTHRPGTLDHRGAISVSGRPVFASTVATGAVLTRAASGGGKTDSLSIFGLDSAGAVATARTISIPATIRDSCDSFAWPIAGGDFRNYDSQVTFRGGTGPVAVTKDQIGNALAAAVLYNGGITGSANPFNAIAAARFDPALSNSAVSWTLIAWVNSSNFTGKELVGDFGMDGAPNTGDTGEGDGVINNFDAPIGRLAAASELGTGLSGPSLSAPTFDSAGNAYFISAVSLKKRTGPTIQNEFKIALVRAVYSPANFCYTLDVVLEAGQAIHGQNSDRNYQIAALNLADSDSISTAAPWSGSAMQIPWNNNSISVPESSPVNLGGLVLSARILYDVNGDGNFRDPTAIGGDTASPDEAYNVVLYVGNTTVPRCVADYNADGGIDGGDVEAFFIDWSDGLTGADVNEDGGVDGADVEFFFSRWEQGSC
ncbi:MAG: hypothetical protein JSR77_00705 [Planctomycetes bacterium]|nr:hypothetical protein [Planctomycetota bacterium]